MAFSSVSSALQIGVIGQLSNRDDNDLVQFAKPLIDATPLIPGRLCYIDNTNDGVKIIADPVVQHLIAGIVVDDGSLPIDVTSYVTGKVVPVLRRGRIWVKTFEAVKFGDPVFVSDVDSGGEPLGTFGMQNTGGDTTDLTNWGFQWSGANASGMAELIVNLP